MGDFLIKFTFLNFVIFHQHHHQLKHQPFSKRIQSFREEGGNFLESWKTKDDLTLD